MQTSHGLTVYNASAGSGKTYTLVKAYLKILLGSNKPLEFRHILAITFTNKAVGEMKERIIHTLKTFSDASILEASDPMFEAICEELDLLPKNLHLKSKTLLNTIIHNYAAFDISTIDGFTHKLIRTFAYDLKLPLNFEVELDQELLLHQAVDNLITKAGTDELLTEVLVDFALEKADDDKSWDISFDFNKIAKLLVNENDLVFIETLADKSPQDFKELKTQAKNEIAVLETSIVESAQAILSLIEISNIEHDDFSRGSLPKHFNSLSNKKFDVSFDTNWQMDLLNGNTLYPKRVPDSVASIIEQIQPKIANVFSATKAAVFRLKFLKNLYKNSTPLSVLNAINNELKLLKEDQNKLLISEFNAIISKEIKDQPTPFIYERIGEKFRHYFIDEFQDTSVMQWENLIPLLGNSLSTETGRAMLVGDAKQAIYRWRGGKAEQFIDLFNTTNPFFIDKTVKSLPDNYRSFKEIVHFNNGFFKFLARTVFNNEAYKNLYENAFQNITKENTGYVELSFLDIGKDDDRDAFFSQSVLETINYCLEKGYHYGAICVLVRKKKEGIAIANYLSEHDIPIISSETLLIDNAPEVRFINHLLSFITQPKNNELKIKILDYLSLAFNIEDTHDFFIKHINLPLDKLFYSFETYGVIVNPDTLLELSLYDLVETLFRSFNLIKKPNAYIQFYLDIVLDFSQKKGSDISGFLKYYETKKDIFSIISPKGQNAVQIMTIHKSKGLEFPVVIFPYADLDIYSELEPKEWIALNTKKHAGFSHTLLNYNKDFEYYGEEGKTIFNRHKSQQELDNINLLYVALTRPVEQLYVISKKEKPSKGNPKRYSELLIKYLEHLNQWNNSQLKYSFGTPDKASQTKEFNTESFKQKEFISNDKTQHNIKVVTKSGYLWDTNQEKALEKGNLIHAIMAQIKLLDDIDIVLGNFVNTALITNEQSTILKALILDIVEHPKLKNYFNSDTIIYNELDILTKEGNTIRPDRIIKMPNDKIVIIDYKTGSENIKYVNQLDRYETIIKEMGYFVKEKILVYINENIDIKSY